MKRINIKYFSIIFLGLCLLTTLILSLHALYIEPNSLDVKSLTIENPQAPVDSRIRLVYFSDLDLHRPVDDKQLKKLVDTINDQFPDLVLFGGNLLDQVDLDDPSRQAIITALKSLDAPYGKFAISGPRDISSNQHESLASYLLGVSQFEILNHKALNIIKNQASFNLIGLGAQNKSLETQQLKNQLTVAFSNLPSDIQKISGHKVNLMLAGGTHGGQINLPFFRDGFINHQNPYNKTRMIQDTLLVVSNGIGTIKVKARLFAPPQINIIDLVGPKNNE